ncbi:MAG: indole-3-glycerol phosphate synthase TrpC [Gemmatimonadota bacterium]
MQADTKRSHGSRSQGPDILDRIVESKRVEVAQLTSRSSELRARASDAPAARDFEAALAGGSQVSLIAEVKRRSPGAGAIRPGLDPVELAGTYASAGASAVSVLTDHEYFQGSLDDLSAVRSSVEIPVLRKDFMLSEVQVWEARAAGADAILLIVRILEDARLRELRLMAEESGMTALVEVHDRAELERALQSGARVVGINNRDLSTFETRIETTLELASEVPDSVVLVSESGIRTGADVVRLGEAGVDATLVGEALVRAEDPAAGVAALTAARRVPRRTGMGSAVRSGRRT